MRNPSLSRKRTVVALRVIMTLAAGAVSLGQPGTLHPAYLVVLGVYAATNVILLFAKPAAFLRRWPAMVLFCFDLGAVTALMLLSREMRSQFYVVFFLVIFMSALTRNTRASMPVAAISALVYGLAVGVTRPEELLEIGFTTRIALFLATAIFAGYLADEFKAERETSLHLAEEVRTGRDTSRRLAREISVEREAYCRIEDYRRMLFEEASDGVLLAGPDRIIIEANKRAINLLGRDPVGTGYGHILGLSDSQVLPSIRLPEVSSQGPPGPAIVKLDITRPDGRQASCEVVHKSFKLDGKDHTLLLLRDVGQVRDMQKRLAEMEKASALGRFLGSLAHEINNPLSIVLGYSEMLKSPPAVPQCHEFAGYINEAGLRCQRVLKSFLNQYRARPFSPEPKPLGAILRGAVDFMGFHLRYHMVRTEMELDDAIVVSADAQQIEQVFVNLLTNAVHAMKGQPRRILTVRAFQKPEGPVAEISDTGCGIPPEDMKKLFDRGFTTKGESGFGLGLALCREIVLRHGGRISASSRTGQGTTFTLRFPPLPRARQAPGPDAEPFK